LTRKAQGFVLIDLIFVCGLIGLLSSIAIPRLLLARQAAGSASAIGSLWTINSAELTYALTCGSGFYAPNLQTLGTAPPGSSEAFIGGGLGDANTVQKSGYIIQLSATPFASAPSTCNGLPVGQSGQGYKAAADPIDPTNLRFFGSNVNSLIYEDNSTLFAAFPEVGEPLIGQPLH